MDAEGTIGTEPGPWRVALSPASNAVLVAGVDTVSVHELADPRAANVDDHLPEGELACLLCRVALRLVSWVAWCGVSWYCGCCLRLVPFVRHPVLCDA